MFKLKVGGSYLKVEGFSGSCWKKPLEFDKYGIFTLFLEGRVKK